MGLIAHYYFTPTGVALRKQRSIPALFISFAFLFLTRVYFISRNLTFAIFSGNGPHEVRNEVRPKVDMT